MNLLYDLIYFEKEKQGGISRMWLEYFKLIPKSNIDASFLISPGSDNITKEYLKKVNYYDCPVIHEKVYGNSKYSRNLPKLGFFRNFLLPKIIPSNTQIFHSTDYINPIYCPKNIKIVTTIHDMVFWNQKGRFKKGISYWDKIWCIYHSLKISDRIITVSETSKKSIINYFPWSENKISVIYHGLPKSFIDLKFFFEKEKYFMFIGGRNEYKNYDLLLDAFSQFIKVHPEWKLQVVGENKHSYKAEQEKYKNLEIENHIIDHGLVKERKMIKLLQNASALVIPSLNEGFNFPLLEAMASGCPVLSSNIPVSKEIGKDYATYFSNDKQSLSIVLEDNANNKPNQEKLQDAQKYARTFSWEKSFNELLNVYESCI